MDVFASIEVIILSMLIMAFLQLTPGIFAVFSHCVHGKYTASAASNANLFFIFGVEFFNTLIFLLTYFILSSIFLAFYNFTSDLVLWLIAGLSIAIGCVFPFGYYRSGRGTRLFVSRKLAQNYTLKARSAKTRSDAFVLGFTAGVPELTYTLPLYILVATEIMLTSDNSITRALLAICFILVNTVPLIGISLAMDYGRNLAHIQKIRVQNKLFIRTFIGVLYLLIAISIITFRIFSL